MPWLYLILAGVFEIVWAFTLKQTDGWTRFWPSVVTLVIMSVSFGCLSIAMRSIPIGTAYAVWTGIGIVGTAIIGMMLLGEPRNAFRILCLTMILAGIVGLKLTGER